MTAPCGVQISKAVSDFVLLALFVAIAAGTMTAVFVSVHYRARIAKLEERVSALARLIDIETVAWEFLRGGGEE